MTQPSDIMAGAADRFIAAARANITHRSVHVDTGANAGNSTRAVFERLCLGELGDKRRPLLAGGVPPHLLVLFGTPAQFAPHLRELAARTVEAAGVCELRVVDSTPRTADSAASERSIKGRGSVELGAYLRDTLRWSDNAMLKLVSAGLRFEFTQPFYLMHAPHQR